MFRNCIYLRRFTVLVVFGLGMCGYAAQPPRPFFQTLPKPRVLYLADRPNHEELAETLRYKMPADVTFVPLFYGFLEMHHLGDKPLEESAEDVLAVKVSARAHAAVSLALLSNYDVIIVQFSPLPGDTNEIVRITGIQQQIVERLRQGGNLVVINPGWETVFENTPLAAILPVKFDGRKAWSYCCGLASDDPLARGIPLEITGSHFYGPVYAPADKTCLPLTRNKDMA